jgi:hypothetical protein
VVVGGGRSSYAISARLFGPRSRGISGCARVRRRGAVPEELRRRAQCTARAPLTLGTWTLAGVFFALRQHWRAPDAPIGGRVRLFSASCWSAV